MQTDGRSTARTAKRNQLEKRAANKKSIDAANSAPVDRADGLCTSQSGIPAGKDFAAANQTNYCT